MSTEEDNPDVCEVEESAAATVPSLSPETLAVLDERRLDGEKFMNCRLRGFFEHREKLEMSLAPVLIPFDLTPPRLPTFDEADNDFTFKKRMMVIERFVRSATRLMMRIRAAKRFKMLQEAIEENEVTDRRTCRAWVEREYKLAVTGGKRETKAKSQKKDACTSSSTLDVPILSFWSPGDPSSQSSCPTGDWFKGALPISRLPAQKISTTSASRAPLPIEPLEPYKKLEEVEEEDIPYFKDFEVFKYPKFGVTPMAMYVRNEMCEMEG